MEQCSPERSHDHDAKRLHLPRKPVPTRDVEGSRSEELLLRASNYSHDAYDASDDLAEDLKRLEFKTDPSGLSIQRDTSIDIDTRAHPLGTSRLSGSHSNKPINTASSLSPSGASTPNPLLSSPPSTLSPTRQALHSARHLAGHLVHHPSTTTAHHSILRHSHGLVFYHGPATSIAISIFADAPLPATRTLCLQSKGWSGKAGMRARGALAGRHAHWLDVTPTTCVEAGQLAMHDERAWQRDIAAFTKRRSAQSKSRRRTHVLRETAVVRIPVEAGDGYYRLVLCADAQGKVLCPSPVFRLLSTSSRPSSIRGASLATLPLEVGLRLLTGAAKASATAALGTAVQPVVAGVQRQIGPLKPSWGTEMGARAVYSLSGVAGRVDASVRDAELLYDQKRDEAFGGDYHEDVPDGGPVPPFPIDFLGSVDRRLRIAEDFDVPVTYLSSVPVNILSQLKGYYYGWVRHSSITINDKAPPVTSNVVWLKAVISTEPKPRNEFSLTNNTESNVSVAICLVQDDGESLVPGNQVEVQIMGFIRPPETLADQQDLESIESEEDQADAAVIRAINDIEIAQAFLDLPACAPQSSSKEREAKNNISPLERIKSSYADTRMALQQHVDRIPLHHAGIRAPAGMLRKEVTSKGGVYVRR